MRNNDRLSLLLIESDDTCRQILLNHLFIHFPLIEVNATTTPYEALQLLKDKEHDIVVCEALLARDEQIRITWHMCTLAAPIVIVITADTDFDLHSFPPDIKNVCVQHVAYKPVDLKDLMQKINDAIERVGARKAADHI